MPDVSSPARARGQSIRPEQLYLFGETSAYSIETEGIKYIGSKLKLLPDILSIIRSLPVRRVLDGFSGTTRVSQAFAQCGYEVISNDIAVWSKVFAECYLKGTITKQLEDKIKYLNAVEPKDGWFTYHYGGEVNNGISIQSDGRKRVWQKYNTRKLDAIRSEIDKIADDSIENSVLLTSLILALDKADNTLGHYAYYLREWSPRSFKSLRLLSPRTQGLTEISDRHRITNTDVFNILPEVKADLSYFDPPYGSNNEKMPPSRVRYASYYHIWKTICLNDEPDIAGVANRRADYNDRDAGSVFEEFRKNKEGRFIALEAIEQLLSECTSPYILLSYSNGGRATKEEIGEIISRLCKNVNVFSMDYQRSVMSGMRWTYDWVSQREDNNMEFLFLIEK